MTTSERTTPNSARWRKEVCERCQGNGEIVLDWDAYLHPASLAVEENSVAECPDCDGEGMIDMRNLTAGVR